MEGFPIVEVHWGDAWIETIVYLVGTTAECIILATDLYDIEKDIINTPMIIPWGIVNEWYEFEDL